MLWRSNEENMCVSLLKAVAALFICVNMVECIPTKNVEQGDFSDRIRSPEIITAPPKLSTFELVVGTRFSSKNDEINGPAKAARMETIDELFNMGRFGQRLPINNRRPSFQSGFKPKPFIPIMRDREPTVMLPRLPHAAIRNGPSRGRRPNRPRPPPPPAMGLIITPVKPQSVSVLSPLEQETRPSSVPWPNLGTPGRPIGPDVLKHLIQNVREQLDDAEYAQDSKPVVRILRPTRSTTLRPRTTVPTPRSTVWPTGEVVPVSRPSWLGKLNIATSADEKSGRNIPSSFSEAGLDKKSANVGTVDIKSFGDNETLATEKSLPKPSSSPPMTTENLAYILIGSCTVLSIMFLVIVAVTIHCRKVFRRKKMVKDLRRAGYFRPMAWAREQRSRAFAADRYLHGVKRPPPTRLAPWFTLRRNNRDMGPRPAATGALRYETVGIGNNKRIKRTTVALPNGVYVTDGRHKANIDMGSFSTSGEGTCPCTGSSNLSDEFDDSSDVGANCLGHHLEPNRRYRCHCRQSPPKERSVTHHCTFCSSSPPVHSKVCPNEPGPSSSCLECSAHAHQHNHPNRTPPVSGSNYLSNPDGMIFWSGNNDRLI